MDALGSVVRTWATHAYDLPERDAAATRDEANRWLEHVLLGGERPGEAGAPREASGPSTRIAPAARDWRGLAGWFADRRRRETRYHDETVRDLREGLWALVDAAHSTLVDSDETERQAIEHVGRIRSTLESGTPVRTEELISAVGALGDMLVRRRDEQRDRLRTFARRVKRLQDELEAAQRLCAIDPLTGLANRKDFEETLARTVAVQSLLRQPAALLVLDVDDFKGVNDRYGHQTGDAVLRQLAGQLVRTFPRSCDFLCRYAGDEFVVVLRDTTGADALNLARRLGEAIRAMPRPAPEFDRELTVSVGVAELAAEDHGGSWLQRADRALYEAKARGRNTVVALSE